LGHTLAEAKRNQSLHAVCHMNLDQFKVVNNSCGYETGDRLLNEVSNLLVSYIQPPILSRALVAMNSCLSSWIPIFRMPKATPRKLR